MLKVLIVEDEMLVRVGIKSSIDWESLGMSVIGDAGNGQVAWEIYQKDRPDIILTDIRMPVLDGIRLIEKIRKEDSRTRIIILSCIDEFEYAQKALLLDASGYILKLSMSQDEMISVLEKAKNELEGLDLYRPNGNGYLKNICNLKESILSNYLFNGSYSESEFSLYVEEMKLHLKPEALVVAIMEIDHYHILRDKYDKEQIKPVFFSILNAINELLDKYRIGIASHERNNRFVIALCFSSIPAEAEVEKRLNEILSHLRRVFNTYFDSSISFGISMKMDGYCSLKTLYNQAIKAIGHKYFCGIGKNIYIQDIYSEITVEDTQRKLEILFADNERCLEKLPEILFENSNNLSSEKVLSKDRVIRFFMDSGLKVMFMSGMNADDISDIVVKYEQQIANCETLEETIETFKTFRKLVSETNSGKKYCRKEIITVVKYIKKHYSENITLTQMAEKVELHPNYLSGLFKNEFGIGFVEYVTTFRIEKAKELLLNTNLRSYVIAEKTGFSDEGYFSRTFKKITGISPNEFRNHASIVEDFSNDNM